MTHDQLPVSAGVRDEIAPIVLSGDYGQFSLRYCNLCGVDLSGTTGLMAWSLAGSDLRGAQLPKDMEFSLLERVEDAARLCQTSFLALLAAAFVCWLVRISTSDAEMTLATVHADLPVVAVGVDITYFYVLAPLLILLMYSYFHLSLQKVWESLVNLPTYFPDGLRIDKKIYPWPLARISELVFPTLWRAASCYSKCRVGITVLLFWFLVPACLVAYWLHYIQQHNLLISGWHVALLVGALALDVSFAGRALQLITHSRKETGARPRELSERWYTLDAESVHKRWLRVRRYLLSLIVVIGAIATAYTVAVIRYQVHWPSRLTTVDIQNLSLQRAMLDRRDLDGLKACSADLRDVNLTGSSLCGADFRGADLRGAFYYDSDIRRFVTKQYLLERGAIHDKYTKFGKSSTIQEARD